LVVGVLVSIAKLTLSQLVACLNPIGRWVTKAAVFKSNSAIDHRDLAMTSIRNDLSSSSDWPIVHVQE